MNKLLLPLILFALLFLIPGNVYASDLGVSCGTSYCTVSTHDPVFPPETKWVPGKTESREVNIQNTDTVSKEIFIRARDNETSAKELDSYMNISLLDGSTSIWQGTLADFINAGNIQIVNLSGGNDFSFTIDAEMASSIPNNLMGKSSVFNFSFGFEGESIQEQSSASTSSSSSNSDNSDGSGESESASASDENSGFLNAALGRFFGVFIDEGDAASVAGEKNGVEEKEVKGAGVSICRENYLWILALIAQLLFSFIILVKRFKERLKLLLTTHAILFAITVIAIYILSCFLWPILISIIIFVVPVVWLLIKNRKEISGKISL